MFFSKQVRKTLVGVCAHEHFGDVIEQFFLQQHHRYVK